MEPNVNYTVVGAFVIVLTTVIILGIIWLSAGFSTDTYSTYEVYMKESVSGLSVDAPVEYNGVRVGNVTQIKICPQHPVNVNIVLKIKKGTPITLGTRAKLDIRTLSGVAYIQLEDKGTDMRPLVAEAGQPYPVIPTSPSLFVRLTQAVTQINESFQEISKSIQSLLDKDNLAAFKESLHNIRDITENLKNNKQQFNSLLSHANRAAGVIATQTLPDTNQVISHVDNISSNLDDMSYEIKQNPSILIRGKQANAPGPGE